MGGRPSTIQDRGGRGRRIQRRPHARPGRNPTVSGPRNERASSASAFSLGTFGSDLRPFSLTGFFLHRWAHIGFTPFSDLTLLFPCARPIYPRASVPCLILAGS